MLDAASIALLRSVEESAMDAVCTIYDEPDADSETRTPEGDIDTSFPTAWDVSYTGEPCQIFDSQYQGRESNTAGRVQSDTRPYGVFRYNVLIKPTSRIKITSAPNSPLLVNKVFDVAEVPPTSQGVSQIIPIRYKE
jgi:hypothetical protein